MEEFYISFFRNQQLFVEAFDFVKNGEVLKAIERIQKTNPDEAIQKYVDATQLIGFTSGEKALVFSMNTRWKADFINLRQRLGLEPVRFKFAPTRHDSLAQSPGHFSYIIDEEKNWWRCLWEHELENEDFVKNENETYLVVSKELEINLTTMHGQTLPVGEYELALNMLNQDNNFLAEIIEDGEVVQSATHKNISFTNKGQRLTLKIVTREKPMRLYGLIVHPK
jgi:hypothetical protein